MKRFLSLSLSTIIGLSAVLLSNNVQAHEVNYPERKEIEEIVITDVSELDNITEEFDKENFEKRIILNVVIPNLDTSTHETLLSNKLNIDSELPNEYSLNFFWPKWEIKNFRKDNYSIIYPNSPLRKSLYGPGSATMTISESVGVKFTAETGIKTKLIEAKVGFSANSSFSISDSQTINIPKGKRGSITAYTLYDQWRMDVYKDNKYVGQEFVHKPIGISFHVDIFNSK